MNQRDREFDQEAEDGAYNPLNPPAYNPLNPPREEEAPNPYGVNPLDAGRSAAGGGRPKPPGRHGDLSGALGFDPYDINSILAPKGQSPNKGASFPGSDILGSTPASSGLTPTKPGAAKGAIGGHLSNSSPSSTIGPGQAFPSLGPTAPGGPVQ